MHLPPHKLRSPRVRCHIQKSPLHERGTFASAEGTIEQFDHTNKRCQEGRPQVAGANTNRAKKVLLALQEAAYNRITTNDPIMEQLKQCPEAFTVGEILGKAFDSLKYAQDGSEIGDRYLPPAGVLIPPLV